MKRFKCKVCGYVHIGDECPETCPICFVGKEEFEQLSDYKQPIFKINEDKSKKNQEYVIIGGGISAITVAEKLREQSNESQITILSKEDILPYYRINLTPYIAGDIKYGEMFIHDEKWFTENNIQVHLGSEVIDIDKFSRKVYTKKDSYKYDKLVLATGSNPFIPNIIGTDLKNVYTLRNLNDADNIIKRDVKSVVCIGGGILSIELAGSLAKKGIDVTLLEIGPRLMPTQLNEKSSNKLKDFMSEIGVKSLVNVNVKKIAGLEKCEAVILEDGQKIIADLVIISAGVRPSLDLANKIGIKCNKGIIVNNFFETNFKDIYACGDCAEHEGIVYGLWNTAVYQGRILGLNMLDKKTEFKGVAKSSTIKVLNIDIFSVGIFDGDENIKIIEKETVSNYYLFAFNDDILVGSIIIGDKDITYKVKDNIDSKNKFNMDDISTVEDIIKLL